ncbi:MAG: MFS transporter [Armatimonadetes bacterium]|nr:MFS transporter [Armatimonadota bacterium]
MARSDSSLAIGREKNPGALRAFRHPDFRLLWFGAFLSFMGSWIQNVAQGYYVYQLTGSERALAMVSFAQMIPVTILGPIAGVLTDTLDKRKVLIATQAIFAAGALLLAYTAFRGIATYGLLVGVAAVLGTVSAIEMPTRQSIISRVVPPEDLGAAIPLNAMTFNISRILGPVIGGMLLRTMGPSACYLVNGLSFFALIFAVMAIRSDLTSANKEAGPILDLILEGARYTFRTPALKLLFILECMVSVFGLFYLTQIPAIAEKFLHLGKDFFWAYFSVGVGTLSALVLLTTNSHRRIKGLLICTAIGFIAFGLIGLSFAKSLWIAFPLFAILGFASVTIFNTCNTLFQTLSTDALRGRVVSMHIWALSGIGPFGVLFFGELAERVGLAPAIRLGGVIMIAALALAVWKLPILKSAEDDPRPAVD